MAKKKSQPITWTNERRKLSDLIPWERNPRTIKNAQAERLVDSVETFGQVETLAIGPNQELYNGHQRVSVLAGQYGMDYEVDVRVASRELTERERQQLTVYLHRGATGEFDMGALLDWDINDDLINWGFDAEELNIDFGEEPTTAGTDTEPQVSKADELQKQWNTQLGQMWALGEHRIICGDCTDAAIVERLMGGEKADIVFTDPPYNLGSENDLIAANVSKAMDGLKSADWDRNFDLLPALESIPLAENVTAYVCTSHHLASIVWGWMATWADHHNWCVWSKPNPMPSLMKRHWTWNAELIPYATRGKHTFNFPEDGHALCVWTFSKHKETDHPTEKPIEVPSHAIAHSSAKGAIVYDGFSGSGTTLIASQNLGRKCRAIELSPAYVAVALQRFLDHTGIQPELLT